jgi:hypothetical protein
MSSAAVKVTVRHRGNGFRLESGNATLRRCRDADRFCVSFAPYHQRLQAPRNRLRLTAESDEPVVHSGGRKPRPGLLGILVFCGSSRFRGIGDGSPTFPTTRALIFGSSDARLARAALRYSFAGPGGLDVEVGFADTACAAAAGGSSPAFRIANFSISGTIV